MKLFLIFSLCLCCSQFAYAGNNAVAHFPQRYSYEAAPKPKANLHSKPPIFEGFSKNVLIAGACLFAYYATGFLTLAIYIALIASGGAFFVGAGLGIGLIIAFALIGLLILATLSSAIFFAVKALRKDFPENPELKGKVWAGIIIGLAAIPLLSILVQGLLYLGVLIASFF